MLLQLRSANREFIGNPLQDIRWIYRYRNLSEKMSNADTQFAIHCMSEMSYSETNQLSLRWKITRDKATNMLENTSRLYVPASFNQSRAHEPTAAVIGCKLSPMLSAIKPLSPNDRSYSVDKVVARVDQSTLHKITPKMRTTIPQPGRNDTYIP